MVPNRKGHARQWVYFTYRYKTFVEKIGKSLRKVKAEAIPHSSSVDATLVCMHRRTDSMLRVDLVIVPHFRPFPVSPHIGAAASLGSAGPRFPPCAFTLPGLKSFLMVSL